MAELRRLAPPRFPDPRPEYDKENEAQFRAALERALEEIVLLLREVAKKVETP